jgi:hypothetical protein
MTRPSTIEDLALWAAEKDGRDNALWEAQHELNALTEKRTHAFAVRLGALERKVTWIAGFSAAVGGVIGTLASRAF